MTTRESVRRRLAAEVMKDPTLAAGLVDMHPTVRRLDAQLANEAMRAVTTSPGERFCGAPEFGKPLGVNPVSMNLLDAKETAEHLRLNTTVNDGAAFQPEEAPDVYLGNEVSNRVAGLVHVVPAVNDLIHVAAETSRTDVAAPTAYGVALQEGSVAFGSEIPTWSRIGAWIPVEEGVLSDKGYGEQVINQFVTQDVTRAIDNQIINGDGTGTNEAKQFDGLLNNSSIADQPLASESRWNAIVRAAITVRGADFAGPISVIVNPLDALELLTDEVDGIKDWDQAIADLLDLHLSLSSVAPTGTAIVGDLDNAVTLWVRGIGLHLSKSQSHAGFFIDGQVAVKGEVRATLRIPRPTGIVRVTGFSA
jgi:HK97 family phage major capsid protein